MGKEGIYIEDQAEMDRFSIHSDRYSPSFYHFKPHKTVLSANGGNGSMYKEARPESPYFRAGNSYTGNIFGFEELIYVRNISLAHN